MLATIPRKALVSLGTVLVALAITACGGETAEVADQSTYVETVSPVVSALVQSLGVVEGQLDAMNKASNEFSDRGQAPDELIKIYLDAAAVFDQEATTLAGLEEQVAEMPRPKDATLYTELLSEYVGMKQFEVKRLAEEFTRRDILCCVGSTLGRWNGQSEVAAVKKDEINAEAQRLGYPEVDPGVD